MRVLVTMKKHPPQAYLIHLFTKSLIREVRHLINSGKHSEALVTAFAKGILEREVPKDEIKGVSADLILSKDGARWDLVK